MFIFWNITTPCGTGNEKKRGIIGKDMKYHWFPTHFSCGCSEMLEGKGVEYIITKRSFKGQLKNKCFKIMAMRLLKIFGRNNCYSVTTETCEETSSHENECFFILLRHRKLKISLHCCHICRI